MTRYDDKKPKETKGTKEGWFSGTWSVSMLMSRFVEAVNGGWYQPQSYGLIQELRDLERKFTSGRSKMVHRSGKFDDRVRAAAQSYFSRHAFDILAERSQKRYSPTSEKVPGLIFEPSNLGEMAVGDW
jgi:hypothetical protein